MSGGWSLRRRLTFAVAAALVASLGGFSLVLHATFRRALLRELDERLAVDARSVIGMVEERAPGVWGMERGEPEARPDGLWYQLRRDDGSVLGRSQAPGSERLPLPAPGAPLQPADCLLPDGNEGRVLHAQLPARSEEGIVPSGRPLSVTVARDLRDLRGTLATLRLLLVLSGLVASVLAALVTLLAAGRGLGVIDQLARSIGRIDARRLDERLPEQALPRELLPAVRKLNELLGRLAASFDRERRFNADVSHELRTPLSGMLSILELAHSRERSAADYREAIGRAIEVVRELRRLVEGLLELARAEAGELQPRDEPVALRELADVCFAAWQDQAAARRLSFENRVQPEAAVRSDPQRLRLIAGNLIANAIAYTEEGGWVAVESDPASGLWLSVSDSGPPLPPGAADRIFERFARLDRARPSGGGHHGIGLSLVRALCGALGLSVSVESAPGGPVIFSVRSAAPTKV